MPWPYDTEGNCNAVALLSGLMNLVQTHAPEPEKTILMMLIMECWFHDIDQGGMSAAQHCAKLVNATNIMMAADVDWQAAIEEMEHGSGGGSIDDPISEPAERAIQYLCVLMRVYRWDAEHVTGFLGKFCRKRQAIVRGPARWGHKAPWARHGCDNC